MAHKFDPQLMAALVASKGPMNKGANPDNETAGTPEAPDKNGKVTCPCCMGSGKTDAKTADAYEKWEDSQEGPEKPGEPPDAEDTREGNA